jgi:hypothetical protein
VRFSHVNKALHFQFALARPKRRLLLHVFCMQSDAKVVRCDSHRVRRPWKTKRYIVECLFCIYLTNPATNIGLTPSPHTTFCHDHLEKKTPNTAILLKPACLVYQTPKKHCPCYRHSSFKAHKRRALHAMCP